MKNLKNFLIHFGVQDRFNYFFYVSLILLFLSVYFRFFYYSAPDINSYKTQLEKYLHQQEKNANAEIDELIGVYSGKDSAFNFASVIDKHFNKFDKQVFFYLYDAEKLVYWSDNSVPIDKFLSDIQFSKTFVKLQNGWYYPIVKRKNKITCLSLILIKYEYQYHNAYLSDAFAKDLDLPENVSVSLGKTGVPILNASGSRVGSLELPALSSVKGSNERATVFFLISIMFLIFYILSRIRKLDATRKYPVFTIIFCILLVAFRVLFLYLQKPVFLYKTYLFSPVLYASSILLPSFGDLLINAVVFLLVAYLIFTLRYQIYLPVKRNGFKFIIFTLGWVLIYLMSYSCFSIIEGLILNSKIVLDVTNIFSIDIYSIVGILVIIVLLLALVLVSAIIVHYLVSLRFKGLLNYSLFVFLFLGGLFYFKLDLYHLIIYTIAPGVLIFLLYHQEVHSKQLLQFSNIIPIVVVLSVFSTVTLIKTNKIKELDYRKTLAVSLSQDRDPLAEVTFSQIEHKISADSVLLSQISKNTISESDVFNYLGKNYFNESWKKYEIQYTLCREQDYLLIKPENVQRSCFAFFNELIYKQGQTTISCNMYFLDRKTGRASYIAILTFDHSKDPLARSTRVFVEFNSRFVPKGMGYPELLMDDRFESAADISDYSFARYYNNQLTNQYGKNQYSLWLQQYGEIKNDFTELIEQGIHHLIYRYSKDHVLILSRKNEKLLDYLTPFSYLFALFTIISLLLIFLVNEKERSFKMFTKNLKTRIQISMVIIVFLSLVIIGLSSIVYIVNLYRTKNIADIKEKTHSINIETESKFGSYSYLDIQSFGYIQDVLIKFSNVFFTDINLYDTKGILIASSRERVFSEGLIGTQMNAKAFSEMTDYNKTLYVHDESIGSMSYLSAYTPLRNDRNELIGYLNLPYFAKQGEMRNEISTFVVALINIYVLLFALAIVAAIIVSNFITRPLRLIREKMGLLKLGIHSEKIEWSSRDEIGSLVEEYNKTVEKLEVSAEMLAKSERESAWREMAKQVAHEIKNPLTPMKLNVQYLQKAWNDQAGDWDERLTKFSRTMVEQIDTLSNIATAFSDFAKLPALRFDEVDLNLLISKTLDLYSGIDYKIVYNHDNIDVAIVRVDKNQIIQVFTNLIKNAKQAIPEDREGEILITLENKGSEEFIICVEDNGSGIDESIVDKIFTPSFTTKTSGMGLGLAMVKSIIESHGGKIWFQSEKGKGTTFFFTLPKIGV